MQSVDRAITTLEILARDGEAGVGEVAAILGVHKSTASRLLGALEARGLVEQAGDRGRYTLGFGLLRLAGAIPGQLDLTKQGSAICAELAEQAGETVNLAVLQGSQVVNVHQVHGQSTITVNNWVGRPTPLHATSSGKALLAELSHRARAALLGPELQAYTPATLTDLVALQQEIDVGLSNGYAVTIGEYEAGLNAIAAGIRSFGGAIIGAVSVSGPAYRLGPQELSQVAPAVVAAAAKISERMGYLG
ncbi:IclR family transcriptional regulator [Nakamurella antarctica]|uniref:IclR family transcriptional regulator n=1 Tax=Nakamurella antarctica TaxID=1902245 RepID=A0A3G8ZQ26_9ACTN|nr:IclR family transcriptional regulator [Nakamurella antarctica]